MSYIHKVLFFALSLRTIRLKPRAPYCGHYRSIAVEEEPISLIALQLKPEEEERAIDSFARSFSSSPIGQKI
jgi:hypothetical protein